MVEEGKKSTNANPNADQRSKDSDRVEVKTHRNHENESHSFLPDARPDPCVYMAV